MVLKNLSRGFFALQSQINTVKNIQVDFINDLYISLTTYIISNIIHNNS